MMIIKEDNTKHNEIPVMVGVILYGLTQQAKAKHL